MAKSNAALEGDTDGSPSSPPSPTSSSSSAVTAAEEPPSPTPSETVDTKPTDPARHQPETETSPSEAPPAQTNAIPAAGAAPTQPPPIPMAVEVPELDEFGLPVRQFTAPTLTLAEDTQETSSSLKSTALRKLSLSRVLRGDRQKAIPKDQSPVVPESSGNEVTNVASKSEEIADKGPVTQALPTNSPPDGKADPKDPTPPNATDEPKEGDKDAVEEQSTASVPTSKASSEPGVKKTESEEGSNTVEKAGIRLRPEKSEPPPEKFEDRAIYDAQKSPQGFHPAQQDGGGGGGPSGPSFVSEFSHQHLITQKPDKDSGKGDEWQVMPAYAPYDIYDDDNRLVAREHHESDDDDYGYSGLGGAGKGYTKVLLDDDAESATSMDENTQYLFKDAGPGTSMLDDEEVQRDAVSQLQATKNLLTEGQRIAYVGLTRLELHTMIKEAESIKQTKNSKKEVRIAAESMKMWSQKMMIRLYTHMDISPAEQLMIEQLSDHGVMPGDLTPVLMANARVKNPMADEESIRSSISLEKSSRTSSVSFPVSESEGPTSPPPPPYSANADTDNNGENDESVRTPSQLPTTDKIDIDLRWTVLCDLFLVLIADSVYDARSRVLLERVGKNLDIPWLDISRFEKKVTDALEMQQNAEKENWNEDEHMENRRKMALKRRYVMMGLATVGGGLVIGLSAGLLAPVIGAGLAAGFTTIGVSGTSGFLAGAGGAAIITSASAASGSIIGVRAANRRTGAVKTFEYRPLHNNKRVNLVVTVCGWMTGKVDDIRLPFSTVDPVMGDIYSVLWEPEMLTSMGDTINILATEALTQGLQQLLGSTILISLMAALQLPVVLSKLSYLIDNPWAVSLDRATSAGLILADSLIDRNLGTRPITLVGYSLGSRVIFSCLLELARKGALGLVQNVYLFGSPVVAKEDEYLRARTVVSGRFVNGYNRNDWILGYLFRLTNGGIRRVAGLAPVDNIPGLENMDLTDKVKGHMDYRTAMPRLLRECGWLVESDEFTEIEDPDPENHNERQRELINEIEEARKELEKEDKGSKGAFAFFNRRKKGLRKQEWEVYEDSAKGTPGGNGSSGKTEDKEGNNHGVLFDVDAIRAELAKEQHETDQQPGKIDPADEQLLQVKEIKSTLPPMKLDINPSSPKPSLALPPSAKDLRGTLRETRSAEVLPYRSPPHDRPPSRDYRASYEYRPKIENPAPSSRIDYNGSPYAGNGYGEDDGVQMTFDTSFNERPPTPPQKDPNPNKDTLTRPWQGNARGSGPETVTSPVPNITLSDPWTRDQDDDEFGKEKEISMTFA